MEITCRLIVLIVLTYSAYTDLKKREIMMVPIYMCFLIGIFGMIFRDQVIDDSLLGLLPGMIMLLFALIFRGSIGEGDAYLFMAIGILTGPSCAIYTLILSSLFGAVYSIAGLILKRKNRKDTIPYAPFILSGFLGVMALG